jgi:ubiquinone/menaquinone biosynthesis C-methylase UbiE
MERGIMSEESGDYKDPGNGASDDGPGSGVSGYYRDEFGKMARFYDAGLRFAFRFIGGEDTFRRAIVAAAEIQAGDAVVDINCGTGTLALCLAAAAGPEGKVVGTDLADRMLEMARSKDSDGRVKFIHANAENLPFDDDTFDRATSSLAIHEMNRQGRSNALSEVSRVVKSGGMLVVADLRPPDTLLTRLGMRMLRIWETDTLTDMWHRGLDREIESAGMTVTSRQVAGRGFLELVAARNQKVS